MRRTWKQRRKSGKATTDHCGSSRPGAMLNLSAPIDDPAGNHRTGRRRQRHRRGDRQPSCRSSGRARTSWRCARFTARKVAVVQRQPLAAELQVLRLRRGRDGVQVRARCYENIEFPAAVRRLAERAGIPIVEEQFGRPEETRRGPIAPPAARAARARRRTWFHRNLMKTPGAAARARLSEIARADRRGRRALADRLRAGRLGRLPALGRANAATARRKSSRAAWSN